MNHWENFETALGEISFAKYKRAFKARYSSLPSTNVFTSLQSDQFAGDVGALFGLRQSHIQPNSLNLFSEWIDSISLSSAQPKFNFPSNSWFVTFNYTVTLQCAYRLPECHVYHIHGKCGDPENKIVVGHGANIKSVATDINAPSENNPSNPWYQMYQGAQKPTNGWAGINQKLDVTIRQIFRKLIGSDTSSVNIFVFGHSLSDVDQPYFKTLVKYFPQARWRFSYHGSPADIKVKIAKLGICRHQVDALKQLTDFGKNLYISGVD